MSPRTRGGDVRARCPLCGKPAAECDCFEDLARFEIPLYQGPAWVFVRPARLHYWDGISPPPPTWGPYKVTIELDDEIKDADIRHVMPLALAWHGALQKWQGARPLVPHIGSLLESLQAGSGGRSPKAIAEWLNKFCEELLGGKAALPAIPHWGLLREQKLSAHGGYIATRDLV